MRASAAIVSSSRALMRACWSAARRARNSAIARRCSAWAASWRTRAATAGVIAVARLSGGKRSVAGELGDCFLCAGIVDEVLVACGGGDEGGGGGVVEGARQAVGDAVQPGDGVVGEERLVAPGPLEGGARGCRWFGQGPRLYGGPGGDPRCAGGGGAQGRGRGGGGVGGP